MTAGLQLLLAEIRCFKAKILLETHFNCKFGKGELFDFLFEVSRYWHQWAYLYWPCREVWRRLRNEDVWLIITRKGSIKGDLKMFSVGDFSSKVSYKWSLKNSPSRRKLCKAKQVISFTFELSMMILDQADFDCNQL